MTTFVEVCAGCGGLSTGFIECGFEPLLINEIEPRFCDTLRSNHQAHKDKIVCGSMTEISLENHSPDLLMGGVPCQAFSQAGERKGLKDPRGKLILEFNRLINEANPKIFLVENVKGLTTHNKGKTLQSIIELFQNNGNYKIHYKLLNAKDFEVPQKRERIIIVGIRSDLRQNYQFPSPITKKIVLRDALENVPESEGIHYSEEKKKVLQLVPEGGCWVDLPEEIKIRYMGNALKSGGGKRGYARRLKMDDQCLTLLTSPSQKQTDRCHPYETRPLTVREYARVQTFPDNYQFYGTIGQKYKQIGNAVPVKFAFHLANSIKQYLQTTSETSHQL